MPELARTALVVVDFQQAFADSAYWGRRNNAVARPTSRH